MSSIKAGDLYRIFDQLDKNGDGLVSLEELMVALEGIGIHTSEDELELLVGKKSLDRIDFLFFHETIIKGNNNKSEYSVLENDLREAFAVFDENGDGFISSEELQSALLRLGLWDERCGGDCRSMISVYDVNSDGKLDFEEFKNMMLFYNN
ncbi:hypothetical protein M9H77_36428 [Catharanthus roseus]|uniref:Uncharacterized protein n=1 Tax=Catharanthus roseus TaxID=4058 RepID=A0ACB9ZTR1_CATRO|nr:hypothetical protein M9H77_36428 [Catharanthus roseus]